MFKILVVLLVLLFLFMPYCSALIVGGISGYEQAVDRYEQQQKEGE